MSRRRRAEKRETEPIRFMAVTLLAKFINKVMVERQKINCSSDCL